LRRTACRTTGTLCWSTERGPITPSSLATIRLRAAAVLGVAIIIPRQLSAASASTHAAALEEAAAETEGDAEEDAEETECAL
jgi:hypothetical protein